MKRGSMGLKMKERKELELLANQNRRHIIEMVYQAGVGHVGGALSIIDILTVIYELDVDFNNPVRSRVILSKGHAVPAQYAVLCSKGVIDESEFKTFRQLNSRLQGHPYTCDIPEVDATTGLLGQGFSLAVGHAIVKKNNKENTHVYAIAGDGEMQEGEMWEAIMYAAHHKLNNLIFVIDYNRLSSGGPTNDIINMESFIDKVKAFHLYAIEIDGHNMEEIVSAINEARAVVDKPTCIIANTVKGKGISYMESVAKWHSSGLTDEEYEIAKNDLQKIEVKIKNEL